MGLVTESALVRPPFGGSGFRCMAVVAAFDVRDLVVLVTIDAGSGVCRTSGPQRRNATLVLVASGALLGGYLGTDVWLVTISATAVGSIGAQDQAHILMTTQAHLDGDTRRTVLQVAFRARWQLLHAASGEVMTKRWGWWQETQRLCGSGPASATC